MDYLFDNLGDNKVTQVIQTNKFEQSINYISEQRNEELYEDLLKKKIPRSASTTSMGSRISSVDNLSDDNIFYQEDAFMFIMCYVKTPSIGIYSKDRFPKILSQFRKGILEDENVFKIKKITKTDKLRLIKVIESANIISNIDDVILNFFAHFLKVNIVVILKTTILRGVLCNEDSFDTIIITDKKDSGRYRLNIKNGQHICSWIEAKQYLIINNHVDKKLLELCSVIELRNLAEKMNIDIYKNENGKRTKVLKEELKNEILKKI